MIIIKEGDRIYVGPDVLSGMSGYVVAEAQTTGDIYYVKGDLWFLLNKAVASWNCLDKDLEVHKEVISFYELTRG